jgi:spore maturation protein CgeB
MLLAERPPIQIPNNFVDDESAVFFDNIAEMEDKLEYYINNPKAARQIAINGHEHYLKYHTATARARTFLGTVHAAEVIKTKC